MHLLVCDDDPVTRRIARGLIDARAQYTSSECADGEEALRLVGAGGVDGLILDVSMPTLDGITVLKAIRSSAFYRLPVVMLSGENRQEIVRHLLTLGVAGYLLKPLDPARLAAVLDRLPHGRTAGSRADAAAI
jgi:CheY-like chemotaxis protein